MTRLNSIVEAGDVFMVNSGSRFNRNIRRFTGEKYIHASIFTGDGLIEASVQDGKVFEAPIYHVAREDFYLLRPDVRPEIKEMAVKRAKKFIGEKYSRKKLVNLVTNYAFGLSVYKKNLEGVTCVNIVNYSYAGLYGPIGKTFPWDILYSEHNNYITRSKIRIP